MVNENYKEKNIPFGKGIVTLTFALNWHPSGPSEITGPANACMSDENNSVDT